MRAKHEQMAPAPSLEATPSEKSAAGGALVGQGLMATKLYVPSPRRKLVPRRRLIERLEEGTRGKVTLVSAPAGFGKTTLLGEWSLQSELPVGWVSLDKGDNDLGRFLSY